MSTLEGGKRISIEGIIPVVEPVEDKVHRVVRAGMQTIPVVGGVANEIFCSLFTNPAETRRQEWMENVSEVLNEACERMDRLPDTLATNEAFVSTLFTASALAMRTGGPEKIEALKAAVYNSAVDQSSNEAIQQLHLEALSSLTSIHLRLLDYFRNLDPIAVKAMGDEDLSSIQDRFYVEVADWFPEPLPRGVVERAARDLVSRGLIAVPEKFPQTMSGPNFITMMLTEFGRSFINFIHKH